MITFVKSEPAKSHFGISSNRKLHQHNTILSILEFIIIRTNPLTDHCAKQREAHTSFSCYWPLQKSPISSFIQPIIAKFLHFEYPQCSFGIISVTQKIFQCASSIKRKPINTFDHHFVVHYRLTKSLLFVSLQLMREFGKMRFRSDEWALNHRCTKIIWVFFN